MSVTISTQEPAVLLAAIKKSIESTDVKTWEIDKNGGFIHTPPQWKDLAWFVPTIGEGTLTFSLKAPDGTKVNRGQFAAIHGHLAEMLLSHSWENTKAFTVSHS